MVYLGSKAEDEMTMGLERVKVMVRRAEAGFSLLEVGLALSIGILLMGASIYGYRALREQSGDAAMRQKVQDLQVLVEELYATRFAYPEGNTLISAWKLRRPKDYGLNPWGGPIPVSSADLESTGGILTSVVEDGGQSPAMQDDILPGGLYYYRINPAADGSPGSHGFEDFVLGRYATASAYAVAGNKMIGNNGRRFFHVLGGR